MKLLAVFALLCAVCVTVQAAKPTVQVNSDFSGITEGGFNNRFYFYRDDTNTSLSITFLLSGTATFGVDYGFVNSTVRPGLNTFSFEGNSTSIFLDLFTINDNVEEPTETVIVELQESALYIIDSESASYTLSINDDDALPAYNIYSLSEETAQLEDSGNVFAVVIDQEFSLEPISVTFTVSGTATLDQDYSLLGAEALGDGKFKVSNSEGNVNLSIYVYPDGIFEADETIQISIDLSDKYTIVTRSVVLTILNDDVDTLPIISINQFSRGSALVEDEEENFEFTFYRNTADISYPLTVSFRVGGTAVYTATAATDYTVVSGAATFSATRGTVVIPAGSFSQSVVVRPKADFIPEDNEIIEFSLIESVLYELDPEYNSFSVVIINDDGAPIVSVATVGTTSVTEGSGQLTFRFTRVGPTSYPLEVYFSLLGTATFPADYVVSGASTDMGSYVVIPTNAVSADVLVSARSDVLLEPRETVIAVVDFTWGFNPYVVGTPSSATAFILDKPPALPVVALVGDESITEGQTKSYRITRSGILTGDIVVVLSFTGTATIKNDYTVSGGILSGNRLVITMPAGKSFVIFSIAAIRDFIVDPTETIVVDLIPQSRYIINPASSTKNISIVDPDDIPGF
eukprot:TRINITY_DN1038_c0_g1_i1.p1 TRINITY_DN1038_c0_g1~~TRINITY_DN1038_c0_g1_i1.p1  ORF type:complete len:665 (+),score=356.31 TRINITY_DN1038_c0_g1_i1:104-1996(+)